MDCILLWKVLELKIDHGVLSLWEDESANDKENNGLWTSQPLSIIVFNSLNPRDAYMRR